MTFTVTRSSGLMVRPSDSTPSGSLNLSVIDAMPILRMDFHFLLIYKHGHEAAKIIREAFSKALVPYYPLAGRLKESSDGALQVDCTGEGLWFIEASTDCSLESFNYYDNILLVPQDKFLPTPPLETSGLAPLLKVQLTRFTCEGFVIGFSLCHCLFDGLGAAQFLNAVGEFARGFLQPTVVPIWYRDVIPAPESLLRLLRDSKQPAPLVSIPCYQLEHASIDISLSQITKHKNEYKKLTGNYCSTFDVAVASLWRHRTQAIDLDKNTEVNLVFAVNTRQFIDPPLPKGYYGNCFYPARVATSSGWLVEASNAEVVKFIKDATSKVAAKFRKLISSNELDENDNPLSFPLSYTTLSISEWGHVGVFQIDYGWGNPVNVIPIQSFNIIPTAIVGLPPTPKKGIRLVTWCVERLHLPSLVQYYKQADNLSRL